MIFARLSIFVLFFPSSFFFFFFLERLGCFFSFNYFVDVAFLLYKEKS